MTDFIRRVLDLAIGAVLLVVALPIMLFCAIGTAFVLRAWPFFTQTRVGRSGREFRFIKLRTLPTSAPRYASKYELASLRIPNFSLALRKLHLDELPQLLHVLSGKMSLVGPRPEMPYLYDEFTPDFAVERTTVRPGCTGLWQISEQCFEMIHEHPELDEYYLRNRSLRLDLWILGRTALVFLGRRDDLVSLRAMPSWAGRATRTPPREVVVDLRPAAALPELHLEPAVAALEG